MSGSGWIRGINGYLHPFVGTEYLTQVGFFGQPGPDRVRVLWGSAGPDGTLPEADLLLPNASGFFYVPISRLYADGQYSIRIVGLFGDGSRDAERIDVLFDLNNPAATVYNGTGRGEVIQAGLGDDTLRGVGGDDVLGGGLGNDLVTGGIGADTLDGDEGNDVVLGGDGNDQLLGGAGHDSMLGEAGDDFLGGEAGDDALRGGAGNDQLSGADGNDTLLGEAGDDYLWGGAGNDVLRAGAGHDILLGDDGDDRLFAAPGHVASLVGGAGNDTLVGNVGAADEFHFGTAIGFEDIRNVGTDRVLGADLSDLFVLGVPGLADVAGRLIASAAEMTDAGPWIIYTPAGLLAVDLNGTDPGDYYELARLDAAPALTQVNFALEVLP